MAYLVANFGYTHLLTLFFCKIANYFYRAFELALRTYEGPDPLEPWYNYVVWVEQTFTKAGKDGNLNELLEKCIRQFKDDEKYTQDPRFFEVWMKYVRILFLEILKFDRYMYVFINLILARL